MSDINHSMCTTADDDVIVIEPDPVIPSSSDDFQTQQPCRKRPHVEEETVDDLTEKDKEVVTYINVFGYPATAKFSGCSIFKL